MKLPFKLPKPVSHTVSTYYPSHQDLLLLIYDICSNTNFPSLNTCVNMKGSPAFQEVPGALATVKSVW